MFEGKTHWVPVDVGAYLFELGTCESCGRWVQEANAIKVCMIPENREHFAKANDLIKWHTELPPEVDVYDDGTTGCANCTGQSTKPGFLLDEENPVNFEVVTQTNAEKALNLIHQAERLLEEDADPAAGIAEMPSQLDEAIQGAVRALSLVIAMHDQCIGLGEEDLRRLKYDVQLDMAAYAQVRDAINDLGRQGYTL